MVLKVKQNNQMHHTDNLGNWDCIVCPDVLPVSDPISSELKKKTILLALRNKIEQFNTWIV